MEIRIRKMTIILVSIPIESPLRTKQIPTLSTTRMIPTRRWRIRKTTTVISTTTSTKKIRRLKEPSSPSPILCNRFVRPTPNADALNPSLPPAP